ncbi:LemA family protein [Rhodococcoides corynebacterioides]|uniref:LemA family protein n=1 Tax=Rhodococcoides corynebacterioides TaxID=53972 RepID=UPI003F7D50C5
MTSVAPVVLTVVATTLVVTLAWLVAVVRRARRTVDTVVAGLHLLEVALDHRRLLVPELARAAVGAELDRDAINQAVGARSWSAIVRERRADLGDRAAAENALSAAVHHLVCAGRESGRVRWDFTAAVTELDHLERRVAGAVRVYNTHAAALAGLVRSPLTGPVVRALGIGAPELFVETASAPVVTPGVTDVPVPALAA